MLNKIIPSLRRFLSVCSFAAVLLFASGNSHLQGQLTNGTQKEDRSPKLTYKVSPVPDSVKVQSDDTAVWLEPFAIELLAPVDKGSGNGVIAGTVASADAQPVDDAIVKLYFATRGASFNENTDGESIEKKVLDQTLSAKGGHFDFVRLPNDADFLLVANHPSHGRQSLQFSFKEFMRNERPYIKFPKRITLHGKVVDSNGLPISNVRVYEYGTEASSSRDDGTFQCLAIEKEDSKPYRINLWKKEWSSTIALADHQLATSGEWTIAMQSETEMTIRGRAVFADDTPLSKIAIQVELDPIPSQVGKNQTQTVNHSSRVQTETDVEGNFRFVMPSKGVFSGKIVASVRKSEDAQERRWSVEVPKLTFGQERLELKFENRGQIDFVVFGTSNLPDSLVPTFALRSTKHNYNLEWERTSFSALSKLRQFEGLEPGEYEFSVDLVNSGIKSQSVKVLIPNNEPYQGIGKIQLLKAVLGSAQGKLLMPDNQTPASNLALEVYGDNAYQNLLKTDGTGGFHLELLPTGEYSIWVNNVQGVSPGPISFSITDEKPIDMGSVRLKAEAEVFGWFDGKIDYEGGASVGGVFVMNQLENDFTAATFSSGRISNPKPKASGDFHLSLPEGNKNLIFYLHGNGPSPFSTGSHFPLGNREFKHKLIVNVDIAAGATTKRDLHIPLRQNCRDVMVGWVGMNEPRVSIISAWNDRTRWIYSAMNFSYKLDSAGNRIKQGDFTFTGFPTMDAYVLLNSWEYADRLFAIKSIPNANDDSTVIFNQEELSTIQIGLVDAKNEQLKEFSVSIFALMKDEKIFVTELQIPSQSDPSYGQVPWAVRLDDGQVTVPNLGSGKYVVTISNANPPKRSLWQRKSKVAANETSKASWEHSHEIDLGETTNLHLQFQIDAEGKLVSLPKNLIWTKH